VLRDVSSIDARGSLLGHPLRIPVVLAPLGSIELVTPDGGLAAARAAERFGLMVFVSSAAAPSFAAVAGAGCAARSAQLYIRGDAEWVDAQIEAIAAAGYSSITLTVDLAYYGRRERQLQTGWLPPVHRDPGFDMSWQSRLTWEVVERMRERTGLPFVLKGIQTAQDAELAVERGIDVIWVSNHGGRVLDHAEATIETLREVVEAVAGRAEIVVDGGFLRGGDVCKAIALGANAVGLGRLHALALAAGGAATLIEALELLELEIRTTMGLIGVSRLDELDASFVVRSIALPSASPLQSAFPPVPQTDWPPPR